MTCRKYDVLQQYDYHDRGVEACARAPCVSPVHGHVTMVVRTQNYKSKSNQIKLCVVHGSCFSSCRVYTRAPAPHIALVVFPVFAHVLTAIKYMTASQLS